MSLNISNRITVLTYWMIKLSRLLLFNRVTEIIDSFYYCCLNYFFQYLRMQHKLTEIHKR